MGFDFYNLKENLCRSFGSRVSTENFQKDCSPKLYRPLLSRKMKSDGQGSAEPRKKLPEMFCQPQRRPVRRAANDGAGPRLCQALSANPDPTQARTPTGLHLDVAHTGSPPREAIGIGSPEERRVHHIKLRTHRRPGEVDGSKRKRRSAASQKGKSEPTNDAKPGSHQLSPNLHDDENHAAN